MKDDFEVRVHLAFAHVAPSSAADADLAGALANADMAPTPGVRRALWIGVTVAAVLIAAVGVVALRREPGGVPAPKKIAAAPLDGRTIRVHVDAGGVVVLDDLRGAPLVTVELGGTSARAGDGLDVLERAFTELATGAPRGEHGTSTIALEVVPSARAKWRWIQWILQAAASPNARVSRLRLGSEGGELPAIEQSLAPDRGVGGDPPADEPARVVTVSMRSEAGEPGRDMTPRVGLQTEFAADRVTVLSKRVVVTSSGEPNPSELAHAMSELPKWVLVAAWVDPSAVEALVEAPPPGGGEVAYVIVEAVVRTLRSLGIREIRFGGAARPDGDGRAPH